jgi:hypothetical protein
MVAMLKGSVTAFTAESSPVNRRAILATAAVPVKDKEASEGLN